MPVSGLLLICQPEKVAAVREQIAARPWAEVRAVRDDALVVVTDTRTLKDDRREVEALDELPGVVSAHVVFCNVEDLAASERREAQP